MRMTLETKNQPISAVDYFRAKLEHEIGPYNLKDALENRAGHIWLVDVRPRAQHDEGHIPGAISLPHDELLMKLSTLPRDRVIITYCGDITCSLSAKAALQLAEKGFKVQHVVGGFTEWARKGYPVEPAAPA